MAEVRVIFDRTGIRGATASGHADLAAGLADPQHLAGRQVLVGREHHAESRYNRVEHRRVERQGLGIGRGRRVAIAPALHERREAAQFGPRRQVELRTSGADHAVGHERAERGVESDLTVGPARAMPRTAGMQRERGRLQRAFEARPRRRLVGLAEVPGDLPADRIGQACVVRHQPGGLDVAVRVDPRQRTAAKTQVHRAGAGLQRGDLAPLLPADLD